MVAQSLNGNWTARQIGTDRVVTATVPGCIHTDLLAAGEIRDPFYRTQEIDAYWVGEANWEYTRSFEVSGSLLDHDAVWLALKGLDTLATIWINGTEVGRTDNMFRAYEFDVRDILKPGKNAIRIRFESAVRFTERQDRKRNLPAWNLDVLVGRPGHIRKEQCNFGWDWGIRTATCGIWRDVDLVAYSGARLSDVRVTQDHESRKKVNLAIHLETTSLGAADLEAAITISRHGTVVAEERLVLPAGAGTAHTSLSRPDLWWPNGMGDQAFYEVTVVLRDGCGAELDSWTR